MGIVAERLSTLMIGHGRPWQVAFRIARVFGVPLQGVFQYETADAETGRVA